MLALFAPILAMNLLSYVPWTVIFLLTQTYGVRLYYLKRRDECSRIQKRLQGWCSHTTDGGKGYGYSFGYWYAVSITVISSESSEGYSVYLIATEASYNALTKDMDDNEPFQLIQPGEIQKPKKKITVYARTGTFSNPWFRRRERDISDQPTPHQAEVVAAIVAHQKKNRHTVVYLYGPPRTGKSMIGVLVANEYASTLCNTLKPWQPGDDIAVLHSEVEPSQNKPVVLVFDEIDSAIIKIHEGIAPHSKIPIAVADKAGWNHMLDEIDRRMYQDMIIIMTSNRGPDFIRSLCPSYIRPGRVNLTFEMTEEIR